MDRFVNAFIRNDGTVTLVAASPADHAAHMTFRVQGGDRIIWRLHKDGVPANVAAHVEFVNGPQPPLFNGATVFRSNGGGTITSVSVDAAARPPDPIANGTPPVRYDYAFRLESPSGGAPTALKCFWAATPGEPPVETGMGGGEKGPKI